MNRIIFNIFKNLSSVKRKELFKLIVILLAGLFFDVIGLGFFIPVVSSLVDTNNIIYYLGFLTKLNLKFINQDNFLLISSISFLTLFILRFFVLSSISFYQSKFLSNTIKSFYLKLYSNYLSLDYLEFLKEGNSKLIKNLNLETSNLHNVINAIIIITVELIFTITILFFLFIYNFNFTITLSAFLISISLLFYFFFKKKLNVWGNKREEIEKKLNEFLQYSFKGIKEIKLNNLYNFFFKSIEDLVNKRAEINSKQLTINQIPRFFFEFNIIALFCVSIIFLDHIGKSSQEIVTIMAIYSLVLLRLMPSMIKILTSFQTLNYYWPTLEIFLNSIKKNKAFSNRKAKLKNSINSILIKNINFQYGKKNILNIGELEFKRNQITTIIGPSGSGKTTLIKILCGLIPNNFDSNVGNKETLFQNISISFQDNIILNSSLIENIILQNKLEQTKLNSILKATNLIEDRLFDSRDKLLESGLNLSGGQIQRICLARALYKNSEIYIFDEPTSNLDKKNEQHFFNSLKNVLKDKFILIITHNMDNLKFSDEIYELKNSDLLKINLK